MSVAQQPAATGGLLVLIATPSRLYVLSGGGTLESVFASYSENQPGTCVHVVGLLCVSMCVYVVGLVCVSMCVYIEHVYVVGMSIVCLCCVHIQSTSTYTIHLHPSHPPPIQSTYGTQNPSIALYSIAPQACFPT